MTRTRLWPVLDVHLSPSVDRSEHALWRRDRQQLDMSGVGPEVSRVLDFLCAGGLAVEQRKGLSNKPTVRMTMSGILDLLEDSGWLSFTVPGAGEEFRVDALSGGIRLVDIAPVDDRTRLVVSDWCSARVVGREWVLISPVAGAQVGITGNRGTRLLAALARPLSLAELAALEPDNAFLTAAVGLLTAVGVLKAFPSGDPVEYWQPHDLSFHAASREGLSNGRFGGTYRFTGPPPVPARPAADEEPVVLPRPDKGDFASGHLFRILDERRSIRRAGPPLTVAELAETLFRALRVTSEAETEYGPIQTRPYPSGGAIHELDAYLLVHRVVGLRPGGYRYDAVGHKLESLRTNMAGAQRLLVDAAAATMLSRPPDVLIVLVADLPRLAWKYEGIAYALVLKHVGVVLQNLYLVATALGLAPCAVGGGNSAVFAETFGSAPFALTSVGEFVLGKLPSSDSAGVNHMPKGDDAG